MVHFQLISVLLSPTFPYTSLLSLTVRHHFPAFFAFPASVVSQYTWAAFEDGEGRLTEWSRLRKLVFFRGLDPRLRRKVAKRARSRLRQARKPAICLSFCNVFFLRFLFTAFVSFLIIRGIFFSLWSWLFCFFCLCSSLFPHPHMCCFQLCLSSVLALVACHRQLFPFILSPKTVPSWLIFPLSLFRLLIFLSLGHCTPLSSLPSHILTFLLISYLSSLLVNSSLDSSFSYHHTSNLNLTFTVLFCRCGRFSWASTIPLQHTPSATQRNR